MTISNKSTSILRKIAGVSISVMVIAACGGSKHSDAQNIFRYNELGDVSSLDPAAASSFENNWAVNQLFNGLVEMDEQMNVLPGIAKRWEISPDGLEYKFDLRSDVYFHDCDEFEGGKGRKVVASDFVYSFDRLYNKTISKAAKMIAMIDRDEKNNRKGFDAPDDTTFVIHLRQSYSPFLNILTMKYFSVVPKEVIEKRGRDFAHNPVGTGPFVFKLWRQGEKLLFSRNPNYFKTDEKGQRLPYLEGVSVTFMKDAEAAFINFVQGDLDMLSGADAINKEKVLERNGTLKENYKAKYELLTQPFLKTDYIGLFVDSSSSIMKDNPLRYKDVRRAINYAIDKEKFIRYQRFGIGSAATGGFIPPGMKGYSVEKVKGYLPNTEQAEKLLRGAGFDGVKNVVKVTLTTTRNYNDVAEFVRSELKNVGIDVTIELTQPLTFSDAVANGKVSCFRKSWVGDYPDPENFMSVFYSKNFSPDGSNYTHYKNPRFDELYEKAISSSNDSLRMALYLEMDELLLNDAPVVPLYYDQIVRLVPKNISGLTVDPTNLLNLERVRKN